MTTIKNPIETKQAEIEKLIGEQLARTVLKDFAQAYEAASEDEENGSLAFDTSFEQNFWNGILFLDEDECYDYRVNVDEAYDPPCVSCYDEEQDTDFIFTERDDRPLFIVRYCFKDDDYAISAWWLTRGD